MKKEGFLQFIKFGLVGVSNTVISEGVYFIVVFFGGHYLPASFLGFVLSVLNAYYWSNKYVFKESVDGEKRVWWKVLGKTYLAYLWGYVVHALLLVFWVDIVKLSRFMEPLATWFADMGLMMFDAELLGELMAAVLNLVVTVPMNFVINKYWAYRQKGKETKKNEE